MSKAVLISIRPEWCEKIISGEKTIEVRKTRPKLETPFRGYIYRTKGIVPHIINGKWVKIAVGGTVVGEFVCDKIYELAPLNHAPDDVEQMACLTREEIVQYLRGVGYGWRISNLKIYDTPRDLWEFTGLRETKFGLEPVPITRPPQSWRYVEEELWND